QDGTFTVSPKTLTVTADADANAANGQTAFSKSYGQALTFAGTEFTTSGLVNGDSVSSVTLSSSGASASATVAGSPYTVTINNPQGSVLSNYPTNPDPGPLTVTPASLSPTAVNFSATASAPWSGTLATFNNVSPNTNPYTAVIDWGDNSSKSTLTITP